MDLTIRGLYFLLVRRSCYWARTGTWTSSSSPTERLANVWDGSNGGDSGGGLCFIALVGCQSDSL